MQRVVLLGDHAGHVAVVHQGEEDGVLAVEGDEGVDDDIDHPVQRQRGVLGGEQLAVGLLHAVDEVAAELDRDGLLVREELVERAGETPASRAIALVLAAV